jgi:ATP-dependent RNA helicase DeaD
VEHEAKEPAGVTRSQNAMYVLPHDATASEEFLAPLLQRIKAGEEAPQLLVISSDVDVAASLATVAVRLGGDAGLRVVPVVSDRRGERRVREGADVVIGGATELLALVRAAALKLESLRGVCVAWADELSSADVDALEALFAEIPKTAPRVIVATEATDSVEALVERYARRPRRAGRADTEAEPVNVSFVTAAAAGRAAALRRVIDALDPGTARVVVRGEESERAARLALSAMGYRGADAAITVTYADAIGEEPVDLTVLYDLPHTPAALGAASATAKRTIALVQPRQIESLRKLAAGGTVSPIALPDVAARGAAEVAALRKALVEELSAGGIGRELLVLDPLLEDHDPIELAAAALRLASRSNAGAGQVRGATAAPAPTGPMTRVFFNVGEMDSARPGDLVGAIINEGGLQREQVGRVELRDKHAVVEVASDAAEQMIERISGTSIRGRRVQARVDQERPARGDRGEKGERPPRSRERSPDRERPSRERSFDRERPPRSGSFDRERPPRSGSFDRERPPRSGSFDRERPPRSGSFDRERPPRSGSFDRERPPRSGSFDRERPPRSGSFDRERPPRSGSFDRERPRPSGERGDRGFSRGPRDASGGRDRGFGRDGGTRGPSRPPRPRRGEP